METYQFGDTTDILLTKILKNQVESSGGTVSQNVNVMRVGNGDVAPDGDPNTADPLVAGGVAVTTASYAPAYTEGDAAKLAVDKTTGGLLTYDRLSTTEDQISTLPIQNTAVSTSAPVTANGTVFTLVAGQVGFVQNCDDAALYVKLGASASATSFNFVLKAGSAADDGNGGSVFIDNWIGVVSIFAATGAPRAAAWSLSQ